MSAAQHAAVDLLLVHQRVHVGLDVRVQDSLPGGVAHVGLHQLGQVGAAVADHLLVRGLLADEIWIAPGGVGEAGGDDAHLVDRHLGHRIRPRLHYTEHRAGHVVPIPVNETGDGVAGYQQGLYAPLLHKAEHVPGHGQNLLRGVIAVGHVAPVSEVEQILMGQLLLHFQGDAEAADARIDDTDGACFGCHGFHPSFSWEPRSRLAPYHSTLSAKKVPCFSNLFDIFTKADFGPE